MAHLVEALLKHFLQIKFKKFECYAENFLLKDTEMLPCPWEFQDLGGFS